MQKTALRSIAAVLLAVAAAVCIRANRAKEAVNCLADAAESRGAARSLTVKDLADELYALAGHGV